LNKPFLFFTKITGFLPAKVFFRWKVYYEDKTVQGKKIPKGAILMSNHKSLWDFVLHMMVFFRAPLHFQIAEVIYNKGPFMAWLMNSLGSIKVDRFAYDFSFIEESLDLLKKGERLGIFPEGQLPRGGKMSRFTPSCALIALKSGADIIPVYTDGKYGKAAPCHVMIGKPIRLREIVDTEEPTREELSRCNDFLVQRILELEALLADINN